MAMAANTSRLIKIVKRVGARSNCASTTIGYTFELLIQNTHTKHCYVCAANNETNCSYDNMCTHDKMGQKNNIQQDTKCAPVACHAKSDHYDKPWTEANTLAAMLQMATPTVIRTTMGLSSWSETKSLTGNNTHADSITE